MSSEPHRPSGGLWRRLRWIGAAAIGFVLVIGCALAVLRLGDNLQRTEHLVGSVGPWLRAGQVLGVAVGWLCWPRIATWLAARGHIGPTALEPLLRVRHRLAIAALAVVVLIGGLRG